jgi:hypothetical protein
MMPEMPLKIWGRLNDLELGNVMVAGRWFEMNVGRFTEVL